MGERLGNLLVIVPTCIVNMLGKWLLYTQFTPDKTNCDADFATAGECRAVGEAAWTYCGGSKWVGGRSSGLCTG